MDGCRIGKFSCGFPDDTLSSPGFIFIGSLTLVKSGQTFSVGVKEKSPSEQMVGRSSVVLLVVLVFG